jgi:hypothetical protein
LRHSAMGCLKWIRSTTHNVAIGYRRAEGQNDRLPALPGGSRGWVRTQGKRRGR